MQKITIAHSTELYLGRHLLERSFLIEIFQSIGFKIVIISNSIVKELYGEKLAQELNAELFVIPNGEKAKTRETVQYLEDRLLREGYGKDTVLIALGGGVTTDLVGFLASIYLRGVPLILIPTTLLAMVDASIGGKTGVDTPFGKNLIGTFYFPKAIIADLETLKTLPQQEWINGLAEVLKMGLIADASIWEIAEQEQEELILKAIQRKISVIEQDPTEQGVRRILNFGHTIGHALEFAAHYEIPHGEAVAIGCMVESHLSNRLGYLADGDFQRICSLYKTLPFSFRLGTTYHRKKLLEAMLRDKKKSLGDIRFVLIDRIGHALPFEGSYCSPVSEQKLAESLHWMEQIYG